jgi:hypothetical protein
MRAALILAATVLLVGVLLVPLLERLEGSGELFAARPCPPGYGWGNPFEEIFEGGDAGSSDAAGGTAGEARELLDNPNFGASPEAVGDLEAGIVDGRLVAALGAVAEEHMICVDAFKEGHYFLPGVPEGPLIPEGYGEAGGLPNTHYYGRAADIRWVDGESVRGNGTDPAVLGVGEVLLRLPPESRPDQVIGPPSWTEALGATREEGWVLDEEQTDLHEGHIHLGYTSDDGTRNTR